MADVIRVGVTIRRAFPGCADVAHTLGAVPGIDYIYETLEEIEARSRISLVVRPKLALRRDMLASIRA